jgi:hypothetical protein
MSTIDQELLRGDLRADAMDDHVGLYEIICSLNTPDPGGE